MADVKLVPVELDECNDPKMAHRGLDCMLEDCTTAVSSIVIVHEAGKTPRMKYWGRTLTATELRGVFMTVLLGVE